MKRFAFLLLSGFFFASPAFAALHDLQITPEDITLEPANPIARQQVHIYATVHNIGTGDTEATLEFYDGDRKIVAKAVSARAGGRPDEIWALWTPMSEGNHLLRIQVVSDSDTPDENPGNNVVTVDTYADVDTDGDNVPNLIDLDDDNDGILDVNDQFPLDSTRSKDTDGDGIDDKVDTDIDNDGLTNAEEARLGTDPMRRDTDGDGVGDKEDLYPLDPKRWRVEPVKVVSPPPTPTPTPKPVAVVAKPPSAKASPSPTMVSPSVTAQASAQLPLDGSNQPSSEVSPEMLVAPSPSSTTVSMDVLKKEPEVVAAASEKEEESGGATIPVLIGLAVVSGAVGVGFLLKSRRA